MPAILSGLGLFVDLVAIRTLGVGVFSDQIIARVAAVVEFEIFFPSFNAVTDAAILFRPIALEIVHIIFRMTAHAAARLSVIANFPGTSRVLSSLLLMAFLAFDFFVLPFERIAGQFMVELFRVESNRVEIAPFVIAVTLDALLIEATMIGTFGLHVSANLLVTIKTFVIGHALPRGMALQTVSALQLFVAFDQWTRGQQLVENSLRLRANDSGRRREHQCRE